MPTRLDPTTFDIPITEIRRGYYSAVYFWREKIILERENRHPPVLMQVFQKKDAVLCGTDEAAAVFKLCSGYYKDPAHAYTLFDRFLEKKREVRGLRMGQDYKQVQRAFLELVSLENELDECWDLAWNSLRVNSLYDGDTIEPWETVMTIEGRPNYFAHLESIYLGILARRTLIATNVKRVVEAAGSKPVIFFADRFDHFSNQTGDGYAATVGGAYGVATDIMGEWWGKKGIGTIPHALIACFMGDTVAATLAFAKHYPDVPCISLVDFHNDCEKIAVRVADAFRAEGLTLYGVRLDTSENMVDESLFRHGQLGEEKPTGVTPILVSNVRLALDRRGYQEVKIGVSGGFNEEKIIHFEKVRAPVDFYGCGESLLRGANAFTADIVVVGCGPCAKEGRWYRYNPRLSRVT